MYLFSFIVHHSIFIYIIIKHVIFGYIRLYSVILGYIRLYQVIFGYIIYLVYVSTLVLLYIVLLYIVLLYFYHTCSLQLRGLYSYCKEWCPLLSMGPEELISKLLATWEEDTPPQGSVLAQDAQLSSVGQTYCIILQIQTYMCM